MKLAIILGLTAICAGSIGAVIGWLLKHENNDNDFD
jgi:hypothetical protein